MKRPSILNRLFRKNFNQQAHRGSSFQRRPRFEALESRQLLTITLPTIADQTLLSGAPLNLALQGFNDLGNPITYTVSVSNASLSHATISNPQLTLTIPENNPSLRLIVADAADGINGEMVFQLFEDLAPDTVDRIMTLVNSDFYDGLIFHRVIENFMVQGGDPNGDGTGGPGFKFDDEFNVDLQFTSPGLLAMANSGDDTNGSQFFITVEPTRWLDFNHTIFGLLTQGADVLQQIETVPTNASNKPVNDVVITDAVIFYDSQNGVLRLSAPNGTTGTADVTITAADSITGETTSRTFHVVVAADTYNSPPFLLPADPIVTSANTPVSFDIQAVDAEGDAIVYAQPSDVNANFSFVVNPATGHATITPISGVPGVYSVQIGVRAANSSTWDTQKVPVYINPIAPSGIAMQSGTNTATDPLVFEITGVRSGATVELYVDGALIGSAVATSSTVAISLGSGTVLADGNHALTAKQILKNQAVNVGNLQTTVDLASAMSSATTIHIEDGTVVVATGSISGYVYIDADNDGSRIAPSGAAHASLQGVIVDLYVQDGANWTKAASALTDAGGVYRFDNLAQGNYRVQQRQPAGYIDGKETLGTVAGAARGTVGEDQFTIALQPGENAVNYNFGERGLSVESISLRWCLASALPLTQFVVHPNAAPVVQLNTTSSSGSHQTSFTPGGTAVAIASTNAAIIDADSPMLAWMMVTLTNARDGDSEELSAATSGTGITSAYTGGVLTLSGVADRAVYQQVLRSIAYRNTATSPTPGSRTLQVVVNDGIVSSSSAVSTVVVNETVAST